MRALRVALHAVFGIDGRLDDIDFAGRTDRWIIRQIFEKFGVPATEDNFSRYLDGYVAALPAQLADRGVHLLPGVQTLLDGAVARGDLALGLLTGNLRRGAETKLGYHGLWRYFAFGAFADDSEDRNDLGPHALRRARAHHGFDFALERVWVIGDTPHDIICGQACGARTLAVATGRYAAEELRGGNPDAVLSDLSDAAAFWRLID